MELNWIKSSYSGGNGGNCVEVSVTEQEETFALNVRDTKRPDPIVGFSRGAWKIFIQAADLF